MRVLVRSYDDTSGAYNKAAVLTSFVVMQNQIAAA
jgi:hypothetical protein